MSFRNIQALELLWTIIGFIGLFFAVLNAKMATKTVKNVKRAGTSRKSLPYRAARSIQTAELFRFIMQTINVAIGFAAFTLPPGDLSEVPIKYQVSAELIRWGLIATATLTALQSINSYRLRRFFLEEDRREDE